MFRREEFEGTEVRDRMVAGSDWESLVPRPVIETINDIGGVARLQQVAEDDGT